MELDLAELESPEEVEFPVFHINTKHLLNPCYDTEKIDFDVLEKYIYACFSCLPFSRLKRFNTERYLIESYCEIIVFCNKEYIISSILEKICTDRTVFFFEILNQRIKNNEFKDCEEFLQYFLHIWNNFLTVVLHLSDVFKVFACYSRTHDRMFKSPAEIFCAVWKNCFYSYYDLKDYLLMNVYDYIKRDQLYAEKNFFKCVYNNIKDGSKKKPLLISVEGFNGNSNEYFFDANDDEADTTDSSNYAHLDEEVIEKKENDEIDKKKKGKESQSKGTVQESAIGSVKEERVSGKRIRLNSYGQEQNESKVVDNEFFHLLSKEIKDDLKRYKSVEKNTKRTGEDFVNLLNDPTDVCKAERDNTANNEFVKINDALLSKCIKILDKCELYDEFAQMYLRITIAYYDQKMKKRVNEKLQYGKGNGDIINICNNIEDVFNLPFEIETFLCNEQMRCHKFLKLETEKLILKKLKEVLILQYLHILYHEETIKKCIIFEQLESLRILYLFSLNMCCVSEFCSIFFKCAKNIGTVVIQRILDDRENSTIVNEAMTELANFKLNIDRIIIVSFRHSSRYIEKWKETFEQLLNTGKNTDRYMPYIVSLYLNNLLMMHNACMKKMKKLNMVYKEFMNRAKQLEGATVFEILENDVSRSIGFYNVDDGKSDVSIDSDGIYVIKKKFQKLNERKSKEGSTQMTMKEIQSFSSKIKRVFVKYTDIGKNILNKITIMLSVFKFLDNKERFERHFRVAMSKRLLNDEYLNIFLDINVFKALKKECGSPYTKKIEYIIKDIQEEKELMEHFFAFYKNKENTPYFIKKKKYTVKTVCDEAWDFLKLKEKVIYPEFIKICNDRFVEFYKENKKGRSIALQPLLGLCVLRVNLEMMSNINNEVFRSNCTSIMYIHKSNNEYMYDASFNRAKEGISEKMGEAEWSDAILDPPFNSVNDTVCYNINLKEMKSFCFIVTIVQGIVLLLFNNKYEYTTKEIENLTGLKKHTIRHFLKPLFTVDQTKILLYDEANDKLKLNYLFRPSKKYMKVGYADFICSEDVVAPPVAEPEDTIADKNLFIDAAVVHYLKINNSSSENDIIKYVVTKKPGTTVEEIKARIESLLQKEFIGFKNDMYCYI